MIVLVEIMIVLSKFGLVGVGFGIFDVILVRFCCFGM